jgi:sigma-E factor negative regulatory protein RseC
MAETGIVTAYDQNTNLLTIEFNAHGTCKSCGMCLIGNGNDHSQMQLKARNTVGAVVGDRVEFEVRSGAMLQASMLIYGFPLAMLLLGFIAGKTIASFFSFSEDLTSIFGACICFGLAFYILSLRKEKDQNNAGSHITVIKRTQSPH